MNQTRFRLLIFFMSLSLIGIILVQLYWINSSFKGSNDQFRSNVQQVLTKVTGSLQEREKQAFYQLYHEIEANTGRVPVEADFDRYELQDERFVPKGTAATTDAENRDSNVTVNTGVTRRTSEASRIHDLFLYKNYVDKLPVEKRISYEGLRKKIQSELNSFGVDTPFEFAITKDGATTNIRSKNFKWDDDFSQTHGLFEDIEGRYRYRLLISFPKKEAFLFSSLLGITSLSLIFTLVIIIAYASAINQLIKQKQISEIKSDFINNMTHEFKTPIATINLALDAIKNPRIFDDREKVARYLQMIRDENKRMHAQVENVLQISKLDKKELDIDKDPANIHQVIEGAIDHVNLIIEARQGSLTRHFNAENTTVLLNDVHFTSVMVNILDNAIKYSPDEPLIDIYTENIKGFVIIKVRDRGLGMSKVTLKRIFEKFYREHTGDLHNVKGHGLGLAYVKRILDDHNCHITVESEKGKGSTFIIKMPLIN